MGRDQNDDKKRALVMGKFKFLYQDETEDIEAGDKFQLAVVQNKLLGPVKYFDKSGKDPDVLKIYGKEREEGDGFADPDIKIPGVLDLFTVVWSNPFGDLFIDQDIKLFEFEDVQKYSGYNDGPKSKEFCRFYTSSTSKELDGFDSSIFWSAGFLFKHFKTCGVEKWDLELRDLITHYKNWRDWAHEVHNLPSTEKKSFSDNPYSGPASTSTNYYRWGSTSSSSSKPTLPPSTSHVRSTVSTSPSTPPRSRASKRMVTVVPLVRDDKEGGGRDSRSRSESVSPAKVRKIDRAKIIARMKERELEEGKETPVPVVHYNPSVAPPSLPPVVTAPPPGQAVTIPLPGPDGSLVQVQLVTMQPARYKYVNPHHSSWTREVDNFLSRPTRPPSPRPRSAKRTVTLVPLVGGNNNNEENAGRDSIPCEKVDKLILKDDTNKQSDESTRKKTFKPRASIQPPSPARYKAEVNELDIKPEQKTYRGEIIDWRAKFGFIKCEGITGKIFVHSKDFIEGREYAGQGVEAEFQVLHQDSSVVGAKAVNVKIVK